MIEGDEYDTAFFEKTPKFLHYVPRDLIVTSIEFDHADIYRDERHVVEQFEKLVSILPKNGSICAWGDNATVKKTVVARGDLTVSFYGLGGGNDWRAGDLRQTSKGRHFRVIHHEQKLAEVNSPLLGDHNVLNVLACLAAAEIQGVSPEKAAAAVSTFEGVRRRQEFLGEVRGIRFYDDFAHHPTAIRETLAGFRPLADVTKGKLWAVFEPRSNTVRRRVFESSLPDSFRLADEVILAPVYRKKDSLTDAELLHPEEVASAIRKAGRSALAATTMDEIVERVKSGAKKGDVVVFMSNGNFEIGDTRLYRD
ncbi:MAG: Mur ligase family protein [Pseudomonadota bacterium]